MLLERRTRRLAPALLSSWDKYRSWLGSRIPEVRKLGEQRERVRVGVIGVGAFGRQHLAAFCRRPDAEVVAIADRDLGRARAVAKEFSVPSAFEDAKTLVASSNPDGVSIVTPASDHLQDALAALSRGCGVLLEKPVALSSEAVGQLLTEERESGGFVLPAHILRFAASYQMLHRSITEGRVGRTLAVVARRYRSAEHHRLYSDLHPALMTTVHDIDLALWVTKARPLRVTAVERYANSDDRQPSMLSAMVESSDGSVWSFQAGWFLPEGQEVPDRFEVIGSEGLAACEATSSLQLPTARDDEIPPYLREALDSEIAWFVRALRVRDHEMPVTLSEAQAGIRLAEAMIASAKLGGKLTEIG